MVKRLNKKAGMELSVNAIITIIIAVIVMGFLITFISGAFKKVSLSFEQQLNDEPTPPKANLGNPITLSRENMIVNSGDQAVIKLSVYNTNETTPLTGVKPLFFCGTDLVLSSKVNPNKYTLTSGAQAFNTKTIPSRESAEFQGYLEIPSGTAPKTYLCSVLIVKGSDNSLTPQAGYSKDFVIQVK